MFEQQTICPYTGLRSFTEEESIYFKGRDEHIKQATAQLEKNKFLMLTGASGDGKSSLVYAGIVPNARAGFLKARYSNWCMVDFRPERTPLRNLCKSLARQLEIKNVNTVETELRHGFSALVDLYKSSRRYVDENANEWKNADQKGRSKIGRDASNLIILADQFEEFFTNPENYHNGVPSTESSLTINILLETAKIALEQNLPIFIVFTMRSDYIGQCAAFRGLPENIGFSQFFVPRLNRSQLQEVIEEPSVLSGNKISRRLTERLIHDISDGEDQLPILQHALSQIWGAAGDGQEEMDLVHYAMVGGMPAEELPVEDKQKINVWFNQLSAKIRDCYKRPSLRNVLDTHANKLLAEISDYYKLKSGHAIGETTAIKIVKTAFSCLTKIDQSRAVRNRMTLKEITEIIGDPALDTKTVGHVLSIFREPGNTFIRPFLLAENPESLVLSESDVLDITHESLIRNWELLGEWAKEEFNHYTVYQDFYQQVARWVENDKSRGFLLPIGPLTYFENWFYGLKPNKYWVNRYLKIEAEDMPHLDEAAEAIELSKEFLEQSASRHRVTRAVMRFGPRKIAAVLTIVLALILSSFYYVETVKKRNDSVVRQIDEDGLSLLQDKSVSNIRKRIYLVNKERLKPGSYREIISRLSLLEDQIVAAVSVIAELTINDRNGANPLIANSFIYGDSLLTVAKTSDQVSKEFLLTWLGNYIEAGEYSLHFNPEERLSNMVKVKARDLGELVYQIFKKGEGKNWNVKELNEGLEYALNHRVYSNEEIQALIQWLSPLDGNQSAFASAIYRAEKSINVGALQDQLAFNGLYEELAFLYASQGKVSKVLQCVDTLHRYHPNFNDYTIDGYTPAAYFAAYGHWKQLEEYASAYSMKRNHLSFEFYEKVLDRAGLAGFMTQWKAEGGGPFQNKWHNTILEYLDPEVIQTLYQVYQDAIVHDSGSPDELNFNLAVFFKHYGIYLAKRYEDKRASNWESEVFIWLEKSWGHYKKVAKTFLSNEVSTSMGGEIARRPGKFLYLYPDILTKEPPHEPRIWLTNYYSGIFFEYLYRNKLLNEIHISFEEVELVRLWMVDYKNQALGGTDFDNPIEVETLEMVDDFLTHHPESNKIDKNLVRLILTAHYFESNQPDIAQQKIEMVEGANFANILSEGFPFQNNVSFQLIGDAFLNLGRLGQFSKASSLLVNISDGRNRAGIYSYASAHLSLLGEVSLARKYLDSARLEVSRMDKIEPAAWDFRKNLAYAVALLDDNGKERSLQLIRNLDDAWRYLSVGLIIRAMVHNHHYYLAYSDFPKFTSSDMQLNYIDNMLYAMNREQTQKGWEEYDKNYNWVFNTIGYSN